MSGSPQTPLPPPHDLEAREKMMKRDVLLVATAGLSLINGMHFSPYFDPVAVLLKPFLAGTFLGTPVVFLYLASIFTSAMTLLIAGVPAAIYERINGLKETTSTSLGIWFAVVFVISLPSFIAMGAR